MTKPNTNTNIKNIVENTENEKPFENSSILHKHPIFVEYRNEDLLYPIAELDKWKNSLQIMRSRSDKQYKTNIPPLRRPENDSPLHEVFRNIMDKDYDFISVDEENTNSKYKEPNL